MKQKKTLILLLILFFGINIFTQTVGWDTRGTTGKSWTKIADDDAEGNDENPGEGGGGGGFEPYKHKSNLMPCIYLEYYINTDLLKVVKQKPGMMILCTPEGGYCIPRACQPIM